MSSFAEIPPFVLDIGENKSFVIDALIENAIVYNIPNGSILIDCIFNPKNKKLVFMLRIKCYRFSFIDKLRIFSLDSIGVKRPDFLIQMVWDCDFIYVDR